MEKINFTNGSEPVINGANLNQLQTNVETAINDIVNTIYPVGSIYMSINDTNPSTLFGGKWEQLKDRFLLGAGDTYTNGATGGEATHILSIDEIPSHDHKQRVGTGTGSWGSLFATVNGTGPTTVLETYVYNTGGGQPHNNMPPYLAVYMWKRIS